MKQLDLKPVGLTDRMEHNATAANFAQIEDAFNSNAITAEEMYAELNGKLAAEAKARAEEDKELDGNETKLDQKYSKITNQIIAKCNDLQEGEDKLDSDKASKVMLYKWWKELDDKFSACVDELDDKKASKKRVRENFQQLSQLIQQFKDQITKQVDDNYKKMNDKAERVALGTDMDTIRQAVMQVLQEQGVIKRDDPSVPDIKDPDRAASAAGEVAAVTSDEDSRAEAVRSALAGTDYEEG